MNSDNIIATAFLGGGVGWIFHIAINSDSNVERKYHLDPPAPVMESLDERLCSLYEEMETTYYDFVMDDQKEIYKHNVKMSLIAAESELSEIRMKENLLLYLETQKRHAVIAERAAADAMNYLGNCIYLLKYNAIDTFRDCKDLIFSKLDDHLTTVMALS